MRRSIFRRRSGPALLSEANDTARATDWTSIRDVMQVRRMARTNQRRLFMQCFAAVAFVCLVFMVIVATGILIDLLKSCWPS